MASDGRRDRLQPGVVHDGSLPGAGSWQVSPERRPRRARLLPYPRRRPTSHRVRGAETAAPGGVDRGGRVRLLSGRAPVRASARGPRRPPPRRLLIQERERLPGAHPPGRVCARGESARATYRAGAEIARPVRRQRVRPGPATREAAPADLRARRRGARAAAVGVRGGGGCLRGHPSGQSWRHGCAGRGPPGRRGAAGGSRG